MNPNSKQKRIAFGYNRDVNRIVANDGQAAVLKMIYSWYAEGKSLAEIKDILSGMGVPSPQNKAVWGKQILSNILSNPHYLGEGDYPRIIHDIIINITLQKVGVAAEGISSLRRRQHAAP